MYRFRQRMISRLLLPSVVRLKTYSLVRWSRAIRATQITGAVHGWLLGRRRG